VAPQQKFTTSCADVGNLAKHCHNTMQADRNNQTSIGDGFRLVRCKHKNECAVNKITGPVPVAYLDLRGMK
jgi:hypothetical protein